MSKEEGLTYKDSGVDIKKADILVSRIKEMVKQTETAGVIGELGGFGGLFAPDFKQYEKPVLVAGTDGVGTKLRIAQKTGIHDTIGIDLVAMCVNDILVQGATPLFFLDYLACGSLKLSVNEAIIAGIVDGCKQAGVALIGGETAEMPGFYPEGEYDVAGFAVGIAEQKRLITGKDIAAGDLLLGLTSSGVHSNGFSLVRYLIKNNPELNYNDNIAQLGTSLGQELLKPTRIYVKQILPLLARYKIKGISHITGGGLIDNIPRILPDGLQAVIAPDRWPGLSIFDLIATKGKVSRQEMFKTFNMGIGLVLVISPQEKAKIIAELQKKGESVYIIGEIKEGTREVVLL